MKEKNTSAIGHSLETYYSICKEYEKLWAEFAKACKLSPAECGILFTLREGVDTQAEICEELSMPKQTANSAIKKLEAKELIRLLPSEKDQRTKKICFTKDGELFAEKNIDAINAAEERIWAAMTAEEKEFLIDISRKYNRLFKQELEEFLNHEH
ncbi:MarR family transcriptional regulator [Anaerovorax odorimutans]|uniref:MarR family transcriptional regulator n=1 Tax=Anaerovorax odorimutans TaxID=109327 RepID=A0ABT1RKM6_9FIRM|nr:helix-turn-helix domain-containing protein [Anaerovorax odorimutans]MCQ4635732.1 MarR family transcriptional regulator [Anaerovorax odorimutans]